MFKEFFLFDLKQRFKQPMVYIFFVINFALILGAVLSDDVTVGTGMGNVNINSPYSVMMYAAIMSLISVIMTTAFMNTSALRDYTHNYDQILFATPLKKFGYLFGRFSSGIVISLVPLLGVFLAILVAPSFPAANPDKVGEVYFGAYLNSFFLFTLPNVLLVGAIIFALAALFRNTIISFIGALLLLVGYAIAGDMLSDIENEQLANLFDPFGINPMNLETKYWTKSDKDTMWLGFSGGILLNRLLWMGVAALIFTFTYFRFSFTRRKSRKKQKNISTSPKLSSSFQQLKALPKVQLSDNFGTYLSQFWNQVKIEFFGTLKSVPFIVILLFGILNMISGISSADVWYGTGNYPVTYIMADAIEGTLYLFLIIIITYYSGVLVWKERNAKMDEFFDASPFPSWVPMLSKFVALVGLTFVILLVSVGVGAVTQASKGYFNFEWGVYAQEILLLDFLSFVILIALAMLVQVLSNNMYLGFFIFIVFIVINIFVWDAVDVKNNLFIFSSMPSYRYSDMSKLMPFVKGLTWFHVYWLLFAGLLLLGGVLMWMRGKNLTFKDRLRIAGQRFDKRTIAMTAVLGVLWLGTGGFLYYNTEVVNESLNEKESDLLSVDYEKQYKKYQNIPQPRVVEVDYDIDIYPEDRRFLAQAEVWLKNKHIHPIDSIHFSTSVDFKTQIEVPNAELVFEDERLKYLIYELNQPLAAGDSILVKVDARFEPKGIENEVKFQQINQNGTFINNSDFMPTVGYMPRFELGGKDDRKKYGLPERERAPKLSPNCFSACHNHYISYDSDWVRVKSTLSTSPEQIAIAPGSLVKEWEEDDRRYFEYELEHKALNFYSFMSADYEVARETWNDVDLEVYYHKGHEYNVDKMMASMRASLEYCSENFLLYPHNQARIIEFPRFSSFAQAFPGTMPYSESIGFIANLTDEKDIDGVYYVVAHEMAHQWWAHQVIGSNMQGATMLTETFAQYSALMVMEKKYGADKMKQFLKYEMDRYLRSRGSESEKELPLLRVEDQGYVHYRKGSVIMYALKEYIGEDSLNTALRRFAEEVAYQEPPYTTTLVFMDELERVTPDSLSYLLDDFFRTITLYGNRTTEATYKELPNGKYEVTLAVESLKFRADSTGKETAIPIDDYIEIGVYKEAEGDQKYGSPIYTEWKRITQENNTFTIIVDEEPYEAGIDPRFLLVDRMPEDNLRRVEEKD
ncbi:MAG: M1 family aminopeptidase [Bacteroidota bacterium]